jgi:spoIIIJ-associated protein
MSKSVVCEGRTSSEAIEKGLKELGCKMDDVNIKILENEDKKIFFSILDPRVVKVELTLKSKNDNNFETQSDEISKKNEIVVNQDELLSCENNIKTFLNEFSKEFGEITYNVKNDKKDIIFVNIDGKDSFKLIGYRGDCLNALQSILSSIGNKGIKDRIKVFLNINNYKDRREESLNELAKKIEKTVCKTKKRVVLEPMNSYDRKIIHSALQNSESVKTYSIGEEPNRKVVVDLKNE